MRHLFWTCAAAAALLGCANDDWQPNDLLQGKSPGEAQALRRGRDVYAMYCVGCHGENGDGKGPAARFLDPKPRDFKKGRIKFALVAPGKQPRDEDILRTIENGLAGTAMPAWPLLSAENKLDVVAYLKTFSPQWSKPTGAQLAIGPDPYLKDPAHAIAEGERLYHGFAGCFNCHPAYVTKPVLVAEAKSFGLTVSDFRPRLYESDTKPSEWGTPIRPPDFLFDRIKTGAHRKDIVRVIAAGVVGTAMPSWLAALKNEELWALAYYVESLAALRDSDRGIALARSLAEQPDYTPPPPPVPPPATTAVDAGIQEKP